MSFVATKALLGFATVLKYGTAGSAAATVLAEVIGITPTKTAATPVDVSRFDSNTHDGTSTGQPVEDEIPGWVKPGEYKFKLHYDSGGTTAAIVWGLIFKQHSWAVVKPDAKGFTFTGYISEHGEEIPLKDKMTIEITVRINAGSIQAIIP